MADFPVVLVLVSIVSSEENSGIIRLHCYCHLTITTGLSESTSIRVLYTFARKCVQYPQLLEVKLQTSPTIDLGLVCPDSTEALDVPKIQGQQVRHCDVRYALFYAKTDGKQVMLTHFFLTTGEQFFSRFPQFLGKILNKKLQIPLPADFFYG